ncbi:unnamed protein product [Microthlaspi erraticum]|uniref:Uncharacterized protein n=1 Tax=Microthlaspi erraticum TaxID=1685480 RepID=A0A6D2JFN0_9BRAS|nr:unnamed protein product [Microthlaspi erraticum]
MICLCTGDSGRVEFREKQNSSDSSQIARRPVKFLLLRVFGGNISILVVTQVDFCSSKHKTKLELHSPESSNGY